MLASSTIYVKLLTESVLQKEFYEQNHLIIIMILKTMSANSYIVWIGDTVILFPTAAI